MKRIPKQHRSRMKFDSLLAAARLEFAERGYIKLRADMVTVVNDDDDDDSKTKHNHQNVKIYIEDIPVDKRQNSFAKFQESLDTFNQGTGIGLSLCLKLISRIFDIVSPNS